MPVTGAGMGHAVAMSEHAEGLDIENRHVKVVYDLPPAEDDDGWPPFATEGVWASLLPERGRVRIANIPWFVRGLAYGDTVLVEADQDGVLRAAEHLSWSGCCTIRVVVFGAGPLNGDQDRVVQMFDLPGVEAESFGSIPLVALSVAPEAIADTKSLLADGVAQGWWDYEEGCISDAWLALE